MRAPTRQDRIDDDHGALGAGRAGSGSHDTAGQPRAGDRAPRDSPPTAHRIDAPSTDTGGSRGTARPWLALLVALAATGWLVMVAMAPRGAAGAGWPNARPASRVAYAIGARVCHQHSARSFTSAGRPWPVCARCTGLYVGAAAGAWLAWLAVPGAARRRHGPAARRAEHFRGRLLLAAAPTAVIWSVEFAGLAVFSNVTRCLIALPLGVAAAWILTSMVTGGVE